MSTLFELALAGSLSLMALVGLVANVLGLPGNWVVVAMAAGCWWLIPFDQSSYVSGVVVITILLVACLGELLEFAAGALGASRMGGSRRGTALAIVGSIAGALVGLFSGVLIPIPILGPVIASLLLGASGAFGGAIIGERWAGKDWDQSIQIGGAAFWGRLLGTVGKAVCGTVAVGIFLLAIWL